MSYDQIIATHPTHIALVGVMGGPDTPSFTYTIGMQNKGWPEVILSGLRYETAGALLNELALLFAERGFGAKDGEEIEGIANFPLRLKKISEAEIRTNLCQAVYRAEDKGWPLPEAVQFVFPDENGVFPDQEECDSKTRLVQVLSSKGVN